MRERALAALRKGHTKKEVNEMLGLIAGDNDKLEKIDYKNN